MTLLFVCRLLRSIRGKDLQAAALSRAARSSTINEVFGDAQPCGGVYQGRRKSSKKSLALINAVLQIKNTLDIIEWIYEFLSV